MHRLPPRSMIAAALAMLLSVASARAESVDLTRATCADFGGMTAHDQAQLSLWLAGYFAGGAQRPLLDPERIAAAPAELQALCAKSPQLALLSSEARSVFAPAPAP